MCLTTTELRTIFAGGGPQTLDQKTRCIRCGWERPADPFPRSSAAAPSDPRTALSCAFLIHPGAARNFSAPSFHRLFTAPWYTSAGERFARD
jgi:hypothetical protein